MGCSRRDRDATVGLWVVALGGNPALAEGDRQLRPSANACGVRLFGAVVVDCPVRPSPQHLLEYDPRLHAGQRRAQAEVQPLAEGQMGPATMNVEAVRVGIVSFVAIRRPVEQ